MDRVGLDITTRTNEFDLDDHQVVDMFKVIANAVYRVVWVASAYYYVSRSTLGNFAGNMTCKMEVSIGPLDENLYEEAYQT